VSFHQFLIDQKAAGGPEAVLEWISKLIHSILSPLLQKTDEKFTHTCSVPGRQELAQWFTHPRVVKNLYDKAKFIKWCFWASKV